MQHTGLLAELRRLSRLMQKLEASDHENLLAGPGQGRILLEVLANPGLTAASLGERLGLSRAGLSQAVASLVAGGCLRVEPDPRDRRRRHLQATSLGRALVSLHRLHEGERERVAATHLEPDELVVLVRLLRRVTDGVGGELQRRRRTQAP